MKLSFTLLVAALLLPSLGSCGGGESVDPPTDAGSTTTPEMETMEPSTPAKTEETAKTSTGMDELESLENQASNAVAKTKEVVISAAARTLFDTYCVNCHGAKGLGDGPLKATLPVKPASFADKAWQDSVTDEHLALIIEKGGAAVGKSPLMTPAPGGADNPELIQGLVAIVRAFGE